MKTTMRTIFKRLLLLPALLVSVQAALAQAEAAFPQYIWVNTMNVDYETARFGYEKESFTPILKARNDLPKSDVCYDPANEEELWLLGRYKNSSMKESVNILFSPGPSHDPAFIITDSKNNLIWGYPADEMCINSAGVIYTAGHSNKMFNERCKWTFNGKAVKEVKQPFYFVGFKGKSLKSIKLYSQKTGGEVVATVPVGYEIEVLLSEADTPVDEDGFSSMPMNYLVRTSFGLVGWLRLTQDDTYMEPVLDELRYWGD